MDEAEKYQQRLQAIAERRRRQEEEERLARETEVERLKTAQEKRKHLRERWLSEPPGLDELTGEPTGSQETPEDEDEDEDEDEEAAAARREERASQEENKENSRAAAVRTHGQAGSDEDVQEVTKEAEQLFSKQMAQRMFHEGPEGRSVLGMLALQVQRDPKTGATVVRSVAPVSTPAGVPTATAVFDDGRKSIHAVGGSGSQLSTEELGQILSIVDGVGMTALLDDLQAESVEAGGAPEGRVVSFSTGRAASKEDSEPLHGSRGDDLEAELGIEERFASTGHEEERKEDSSTPEVKEVAGEVANVEDLRLEDGPVTLVFLGYTDGDQGGGDQGGGREDHGGMLTAEHIIITEEGVIITEEEEEHAIITEEGGEPVFITEEGGEPVLGSEPAAPPQKEKESRVFQDVPLDGNGAGVEVRGEEGDDGRQNSSSPCKAISKRQTCRCCSVM